MDKKEVTVKMGIVNLLPAFMIRHKKDFTSFFIDEWMPLTKFEKNIELALQALAEEDKKNGPS